MAFINQSNKTVTAKIIYYGPDLAGKNSSLLYIYDHLPEENRGKLVSLASDEGSKVSFEFHPDEFDTSDYEFVVQLSTVSGQVTNELLRQALVNGADGCVFVADMQPSCQFANFKSYQSLEEDLRTCGRNLKEFPMIIQYNKKDLPNILPVGKMNLFLNSYNVQFFETCAISGEGVLETLNCITAMVWNDLNKKGILVGAAHSISKNRALSLNEGGIAVIESTEENSAVALLHQTPDEFGELEAFDVSADPDALEIDYGNSQLASFEDSFEIDDLIQLADKIGPKTEEQVERDNTQTLPSQPSALEMQKESVSPEPIFVDAEEEVFAEIEEKPLEMIEESETKVFADVEEFHETLRLETPIESPDLPEIPREPDTPAVPDVDPEGPVESPTPDVPDTPSAPEAPHEQPTPAAPGPMSAPAQFEARPGGDGERQAGPQPEITAATSALFAGDIRIQLLFSYLENAI
ncbi:MAG TPA: hypothetical protein VLH08_16845, partial [Acidobacteriota bacterium]|nr:hypothetical protein [Acidobacteriota bacterium]